jgi:hypothetical protein
VPKSCPSGSWLAGLWQCAGNTAGEFKIALWAGWTWLTLFLHVRQCFGRQTC